LSDSFISDGPSEVYASDAGCPLPRFDDIFDLCTELEISLKDLMSMSSRASSSYRTFYIETKSGKLRRIDQPHAKLAALQRKILRYYLRLYDISFYARAYRKGTGVAMNAAPHVGKRYLLKMDLSDFFGHITSSMLKDSAFSSMHCTEEIADVLTRLCTRNGVLPQGAPTSPALSNIVMKSFDDSMGRWCRSRSISYTRYSDDLTFSSDLPLYPAYRKACSTLKSMGFEVNSGKTHFITSAGRQQVTGIVVNDKLGIPSDYRRKLRQELYYVLKFGAEDVFLRSGDRQAEPGLALSTYLMRLMGRTEYVLQYLAGDAFFLDARYKLSEMISRCSSVGL